MATDDSPLYPGLDWMPVDDEEVYSPTWGSYGIVKHVNRVSAIVHVEAENEWHELYFDQFHKSRRQQLRAQQANGNE